MGVVLLSDARIFSGAMTYLQFHLLFNVPLLFVLTLLGGGALLNTDIMGPMGLVLVIVVLFTTPWDNYAAWRGIWGFKEGRYLVKWAYLPMEEYLFFILQSLQAMLLTIIILGWLPDLPSMEPVWPLLSPASLAIGAALSLLFLFIGWRWGLPLPRFSKWQYTWHLFFWFGLVIALQWWVGWHILLPRWPVLVSVTLLLGTWLSLADWVAVKQEIWFFDERLITGKKIANILPWEEAAFFYTTNLIVCQSLLLFLPEFLR
jgi:lycopene cyclase domain-containing protein